MIPNALRRIAIVGVLLAAPGILGAGANTWTGGRPIGTAESAPALVAADPGSPEILYGSFGSVLYRSSDGGRTWRHLRSFFYEVGAVLVHPASPSTVYVADYLGVHRSSDAGETWSFVSGRYLEGSTVTSLAGSPTDASTLYAGAWNRIFKTTDGGATWSRASLSGIIGSLVIDPREPTIAYAAAEGYSYWGSYPGSFGKSTDGGASWRNMSPPALDSVLAVAVESVASSTVYAAAGPYRWSGGYGPTPEVLRSEDRGVSWMSASAGLPEGIVRSLAVDPTVLGTLYAGTEAGVYRSRDGGRSWTPFSQQLAGVSITSLAIADSGRVLHAETSNGVYHLEIASGPMDVAAGPAGASRVLVWDGDRLGVSTLDGSGHWTSTPPGDASATWTAIAIAAAGGERSHVLWQSGDGRGSLEIIGPSGRQSATVFEKRSGWIATDLSVRADGRTNVLWTGSNGRMSIARVDSNGAATEGPVYGPASGWSAVAIADGPGGDTWVLWRSSDGRAALSVHREGTMVSSYKYAAHQDGAVEDVTVAADGRPRILRTSPAGLASVATVDAAGELTTGQHYELPGFTPRRIAAGADGRTRLLFGSEDGHGDLLLLNPDNTLSAHHALEAALAPANSGKQILVRAGAHTATYESQARAPFQPVQDTSSFPCR